MNITKIKLNGDNTAVIHYELKTDNSIEKREYKGIEKVVETFNGSFLKTRETFCEYFQKLRSDIAKIKPIQIEYKYKSDVLKTIKYTVLYIANDDIRGCEISTPELIVWNDKPEANKYYICGQDLELALNLQELAKNYINGDTRTKQMKLEVVND